LADDETYAVEMKKLEIDDAHKDKQKIYTDDFKVSFFDHFSKFSKSFCDFGHLKKIKLKF
jgi:hypothetical protein